MKRPRSPKGITIVGACVFVLAFGVRLAWVLRVLSPLDSVYSDMGGYVDRAQDFLTHNIPGEPRILCAYPPGTSYLMALEFFTVGRDSRYAIGIIHSIVGAIPAPCMAALALNLVPRLSIAAVVGTLVALWYPHVSFVGFFSSEVWFSAAIAVHTWLTVRNWRSPPGKVAVGIAAALAFVIRPQFVLAWAIELGSRGLRLIWRWGPWGAVRSLFWLALPVALTITATSVRFHRCTGRWGLISESGLNRVWADTDLCGVGSTWQLPKGGTWTYGFSPPSRQPCEEKNIVRFDGYIADPVILDKIREERLRGVSLRRRIARRFANIELLVAGNLPWPESNYREPPIRAKLQTTFAQILLVVILPLAAVGLALGRRSRTMLIIAANLGTVVFAAAFFFGEARYNIPVVPFALLLATVGAYELLGRGRRAFLRSLSLRSAKDGRFFERTGTDGGVS